jgi:hypothetical protein
VRIVNFGGCAAVELEVEEMIVPPPAWDAPNLAEGLIPRKDGVMSALRKHSQESRELKRASEILLAASSVFARELD